MARKRTELQPEVLKLLGQRTDRELAKMAGVSVWKIHGERKAREIPTYRSTKKKKPSVSAEPRFPPIDEKTLSLLGTMPDATLAELYGYNRERLGRVRRKLGIPKSKDRPKTAPKLPKKVIALMSTIPDKELAEKSGFTLKQIRWAREKRKIKVTWRGNGIPQGAVDQLGTRPDTQIAKEFGVSQFRVLKARQKLNIPAYSPKNNPDPE